MKPFKDYDKTKSYGDYRKLPKDGYVMKILGVEENQYDSGTEYFEIKGDINEGEYFGFFREDYDNQTYEDKFWKGTMRLEIPDDDGSERDGWRKRRFKTFTEALEDSNPGYTWDWDENKWKGKLIGGLFNNKESKSGTWFVNWKSVCSVDKIRDNSYKLPQDEPLKNKTVSATNPNIDGDWMKLPEGEEEQLPFV